jgi:hypothetical protein
MKVQPGRVISVRVNPRELRKKDEIAREKNMKIAGKSRKRFSIIFR